MLQLKVKRFKKIWAGTVCYLGKNFISARTMIPIQFVFKVSFFLMRISSHGGHHWFGGPPPLTGVIYLSLLSKQPISVRCQPPNGGFYLNKEKWPKSQRRHSNTGHCQISAHTPEIGSLDSPQIFRFGVKFLEILFLWGATSLDSSGPLNDFLNWRKFSWLPHNGLDTGGL